MLKCIETVILPKTNSEPMICTDGHLYGHQNVLMLGSDGKESGSIPATSTNQTL